MSSDDKRDGDRPERDDTDRERVEQERAERELERAERERAARAQVDREEKERELRARERVFTERMDRDRAERGRKEREGQGARERMEPVVGSLREGNERDSVGRDGLERERMERDAVARELAAREEMARERTAREKMARERTAREDVAREAVAREGIAAESLPRDPIREPTGRDPMSRDPMGRDLMRRDPMDRDPMDRDDIQRVNHGDIPAGVQQRLYEAEQSQSRRRMLLVIFLIALGAAAYWGWLEWQKRQTLPEPVASAPAAKQEAQPAGPPPIQHPIAPTNEPLPALADSDAAVTKALGDLVGAGRLADVMVPGNVVRKIVASVDNAGRQQLYTRTTPLKPPPSKFMVSGTGDARTINPRNATRYAIYAQVVEQVDAQKFATTYQRHYPLFQQAYEELGYPGRYFNDRLVEVIDLMIATPDAPAAPTLVQPKINFEYADPRLESLTAGQKALVRMGPAESARIKAKLREIRAAISVQPGAATTASTAKGG